MNASQFAAPLCYEERIVVFFDVLGWQSHVREAGNDAEKVGRLACIPRMLKSLQTIAIENGDNPLCSQMTSFSDCCVISIPFNEDILPSFVYGLCNTFIGSALLGFLLRAGVTVGQIHHENDIVFGPAMNRAHELESSGFYPRIMLDQNIPSIEGLNILSELISQDIYGKFVDPYQLSFIRSKYLQNQLSDEVLISLNTADNLFNLLSISLQEILQKTINNEHSTQKHIEQAKWPYMRATNSYNQIITE